MQTARLFRYVVYLLIKLAGFSVTLLPSYQINATSPRVRTPYLDVSVEL